MSATHLLIFLIITGKTCRLLVNVLEVEFLHRNPRRCAFWINQSGHICFAVIQTHAELRYSANDAPFNNLLSRDGDKCELTKGESA